MELSPSVHGPETRGDLDWVPSACSLPTAEQPLRVAEFDDLFSSALREVERLGPSRLRLTLDVETAAPAEELTERETQCCSFFAFTHVVTNEQLALDVEVPVVHVAVLDSLERRARTLGPIEP